MASIVVLDMDFEVDTESINTNLDSERRDNKVLVRPPTKSVVLSQDAVSVT